MDGTSPTDTYTPSLHDALPIWLEGRASAQAGQGSSRRAREACPPARGEGLPATAKTPRCSGRQAGRPAPVRRLYRRSEEHTSELQSRLHLVCRLLLEKKKTTCK